MTAYHPGRVDFCERGLLSPFHQEWKQSGLNPFRTSNWIKDTISLCRLNPFRTSNRIKDVISLCMHYKWEEIESSFLSAFRDTNNLFTQIRQICDIQSRARRDAIRLDFLILYKLECRRFCTSPRLLHGLMWVSDLISALQFLHCSILNNKFVCIMCL